MKELLIQFKDDFLLQVADIKRGNIKRQIPNMLTFSRAFAPLIIIPTVLLGRIDIAIIALGFFAITDFLDGKLARKFNCTTEFGVKLDAICDKFFAFGIMVPAIIKYPVLLINLVLEFCISYINILSETKHNHPKSNMIGKIKTTFLSITLVLAYFPRVSSIYVLLSSIITAMLQIGAFVQYKESDDEKEKEKKK